MNKRRENNTDEHTLHAENWPRKMSLSEACKFLGVSHAKMTVLVHTGELSIESDSLDRRVKLVKRSDLEKLKRRRLRR